MSDRINMVGKKFNKLLVVSYSHTGNFGKAYWKCQCDCGAVKCIRGDHVKSGRTKSCGCRIVEASTRFGESNPSWNGGRILTDSGYIRIKSDKHPRANSHGYIPEHVAIAELALGEYIPAGHVIHHINGDRSDNRLENLWWFPSRSAHSRHHQKLIREAKNEIHEG